MSGYCNDCGNALCLCDEIKEDEKRKTMVTHDICQPWEVELARLKKRLEEAEEVIGFYERYAPISDDFLLETNGAKLYFTCDIPTAKRAREYIAKYGEKK